VIGIMLTAYLSMLSNRQALTQRSQVWNNCIPMCEAGVEEALAHLNHRLTGSNFAINGWVLAGGFFFKERSNFNGGSYLVRIDTNYPPAITAQGRLLSPIGAAPISRRVRVQTKLNHRFPDALLAKTKIICGGNGRVDSFNSTNLLESTNGQYNAALATDRARVATVSRTPGDLSVGNVSIYGSVGTGPGGSVFVGPNGNVGSESFNDSGADEGKIEDGHQTDDVNVYIPDAALPVPWGPTWTPQIGNIGGIPGILPNTWIGGTTYTYLLDREGDYQIASINMSSGHKMMITKKVRIYVGGQTQLSSDAEIIIGPGGSVEWYAGNNVSMGGKGLVNNSGVAKNFSLVGLNNCVDITYSGFAQFIGTIYAPRAKVTITGSADAFGAIVANEINLQGTMSFHYDEALKADPNGPKYVAASWREL
jgi:hypothetical protein